MVKKVLQKPIFDENEIEQTFTFKKNQIPGKWKIPGSGFNQNSYHGIPVSLR